MRITPSGADHVEVTFSDTEFRKMEAKDWETLNEFALLIQKYNNWKHEIKVINTKRMLDTAQ